MFLNKCFCTRFTLNGVRAVIMTSKESDKALLVLVNQGMWVNRPSREEGGSPFTKLFWQLVDILEVEPPESGDHPSNYKNFEFPVIGMAPKEVLSLLEEKGVKVKVVQIDHQGDDKEVVQATLDFASWINEETIFVKSPSS